MQSIEERRKRDRDSARSRYHANRTRISTRRKAIYLQNRDRLNEAVRLRARERRAFISSFKTRPCADCGGVFPPHAMDFDHRDGTTKFTNVSNLVNGAYPKDFIAAEIAKCDLVCANCHRIRTHNRGYARPIRPSKPTKEKKGMRITDLSIKALKAPENGATVYPDDTLKGFGVRVSEGGTKSFVLTHGPRRQRETIGRVGILGLQEARAEAKRRLAEYTLGKAAPRSILWATALSEYLAEIERTRRPRTHRDYTRLLNKHFRFGLTDLNKLTPADFDRKLSKLTDRPTEHFHAFAVVHSFVRWAYRKHYFEIDPLDRMEPPKKPRSRERTLTEEELALVFNLARSGTETFDTIVCLLILLGQRRSLTGMFHRDWVNVPNHQIIVPGEFTKNHAEHCFPIGDMAAKLLDNLPRSNHSPYLFPASNSGPKGTATVFNGWSKAKSKYNDILGIAPWTLHDLRRTLRTNWAALGVSKEVAEKYINHISGSHSGINAIYDRYTYYTEMQDAVEKWEAYLQTLIA